MAGHGARAGLRAEPRLPGRAGRGTRRRRPGDRRAGARAPASAAWSYARTSPDTAPRPGRGDDGRDPDAVVRRPAEREPGHVGDRGADPGDPVEVADGVLRQPAAPPLHVGVDRAPRRCPAASARSASDSGDQLLVGALQRRPPRRAGPSEVRRWTSPCSAPASRTQPHLANENVEALIARPSTGGTRNPEESSSPATSSARNAKRDHDHRGVLDPGQLGGGHRRDLGEQPGGRRGRRGRARRRPPRSAPGRSSGRPRPRSRPRCGPARAPSRRCARRRSRPARLGQPGHARRAARRRPGTSLARQLGAEQRPARRQRRPAAGTVARAESRRAWPAYTPPSSGSTSRSTTSSPSRLADQVADRDVVVDRRRRAARPRPGPAPSSDRTPDARSSSQVERHAHHRARQRPQRAAGPDPRRLHRRVHDLQPELAGQRDALGPAVEHRLGADVDHDAADLGPAQLAAGLGRGLEHGDVVRRRRPRQVRRGQPGEPTADHHVPARPASRPASDRPRAAPAGCGSGRHEESQAGSDSRPKPLRWKTSGREVSSSVRLDARAAAAARSCGPRPRPRGRSCSRSGPAPRRG